MGVNLGIVGNANIGELGNWKIGELENWKIGSLEVWKFGSLEGRQHRGWDRSSMCQGAKTGARRARVLFFVAHHSPFPTPPLPAGRAQPVVDATRGSQLQRSCSWRAKRALPRVASTTGCARPAGRCGQGKGEWWAKKKNSAPARRAPTLAP